MHAGLAGPTRDPRFSLWQWSRAQIPHPAVSASRDHRLRTRSWAGGVFACTFGARPAFSSLNLDEVSLDRKFDMIWCGSLVTHLNESGIVSLLKLFERHLAAGGLMIFTTHGDFVQRRIPTREFDYGLAQEQIDRIGIHYAAAGYGFEDYPGRKAMACR